MLPRVVIVGRPNVGKSSLFNRILGRREAIVDSVPGVTRDRVEAPVAWQNTRFLLTDTGGIVPGSEDVIDSAILHQIDCVLEDADLILFMIDAREGVTAADEMVVEHLNRYRKKTALVLNKVDDQSVTEKMDTSWTGLGFEKTFFLSAERGTGLGELWDFLSEVLPRVEVDESEHRPIPVALIGKPNVGKSTLVNALIKSERSIVSNIPGTTRDAIDSYVEYEGRMFRIIDTAGIRRKARVSNSLENISIIRAKRAIRMAQVVLLMIDAGEGLSSQDLALLSYVEKEGRGIIILVNKWDKVEKDHKTFDRFRKELYTRIPLLSHSPVISISALNSLRISRIFPEVIRVYDGMNARVSTSRLNADVHDLLERNQPPHTSSGRPKVFYVTQAEKSPPTFVFFVNNPDCFKQNYRNYLHNQIRKLYGTPGVPIRLVFKPKPQRTRKR